MAFVLCSGAAFSGWLLSSAPRFAGAMCFCCSACCSWSFVLQKLKEAEAGLGLEVHGLLVGRQVTDPMRQLCTHLHVFKSWSTVGGEGGAY